MKSIIDNQKVYHGKPESKLLYEWIQEVDLDKWNILIKSPVVIRNFVSQYTDYKRDRDQFNINEYWQDPKIILESRNDDCEGLNNLACNIMYSLGFDCRLTLGRYDTNNVNIKPEKRFYNHAYGLLYNEYTKNNPYIIDCTGDDLLTELSRIDNHSEYYTWFMGSGILKQNFKCNHLAELEN